MRRFTTTSPSARKSAGRILYAAVILLTLNSCGALDDDLLRGSSIRFGVKHSSSTLGTKAAYGSGSTFSADADRNVLWENDDLLRIACNECIDTKNAVYKAVSATSGGQAGLQVDTSSDNLRWGTGTHNIYAVYPSTSTIAESTGTLTATVAAFQTGTATSSSDDWTVAPAMDNLVLVSKISSAPTDDALNFPFTALSTAIKMQITNNRGAAMRVASIALQSTASQNLSGSFTADMSSWTQNVTSGSYTYPTCTAAGSNTQAVTITTTYGTNDYLEIADQGTLTATFFLLPTAALYDLKFVITFSDASTLSTVIKRTDGGDDTANRITFPAHKKSYVTGILVPKGIDWTSVYVHGTEDYTVEDSQTGETYWK